MKDLIRVIGQEAYEYRDPVTDFLHCLFVDFDFEGAQAQLAKCEEVRARRGGGVAGGRTGQGWEWGGAGPAGSDMVWGGGGWEQVKCAVHEWLRRRGARG